MDWSDLYATDGDPIEVNVASHAALISDLESRLSKREGFSLATLNLDHLVKFAQQPDFRTAYAAHSHVTADGNPIVWLLRLAGQEIEFVPGADLVDPIVGLAARLGVPVAFLGSTDESLTAAEAALAARYPKINVVAKIAPPMGFDPEGPGADDAIAKLEVSGARLCLLALGAPKQELFAARAQHALPQTGFLSIGAGLDFQSGVQTRAPALVRKLALEWLWRLMSNPRRLLGRYLSCFAILPQATRAALRARRLREG